MKQIFKNKVVNEIFEWIICFVIAYVIYVCINYFLGTIAGIKQTSMFPTAKEGERVLVGRRVLYNHEVKRGQIVTITAPDYTDNTDGNLKAGYIERHGFSYFTYNVLEFGKKSYIKRVIAVGGDTIEITEEGSVLLNGEVLEETYLPEGTVTPITGAYYSLEVPEGCVFVMGDNRAASRDSREFGVVPLERVEGIVGIRVWPLNKIGEI